MSNELCPNCNGTGQYKVDGVTAEFCIRCDSVGYLNYRCEECKHFSFLDDFEGFDGACRVDDVPRDELRDQYYIVTADDSCRKWKPRVDEDE